MNQRYGIILLDNREIVFRIYEANGKEWKLHHYYSSVLPDFIEIDATAIMEIIAEFLTTEHAQHIAEWKTCSRYLPKKLIADLSSALGFKIETISPLREQELLCKGMFTELW